MLAVTTAAQARAGDQEAIRAGTDSFDLMRRAGDRAAHLLLERLPRGAAVQIYVGPGNNGGDGWVIAHELDRAGCAVRVKGVPPATDDARRAKSLCRNDLEGDVENPHAVVDAVLGTGATGELRGDAAGLIATFNRSASLRVAVDLPSGLDASTGWADPRTPPADLTVTFGSWKRGALLRRDLCGELCCLEIGLPDFPADLPRACDLAWARSVVPPIGARADKNARRRLLIVGGARGMAGAAALAARGAFRASIGMVRCAVDDDSVLPLQLLVPQAVVRSWKDSPSLDGWAHAVVLGPGLGSEGARERVTAWLEGWAGPVVLDADALNAWAGDATSLAPHLAGRPAVLTPHAAEAARLLGAEPEEVGREPFAAATALASVTRATVVLKGSPTVVADSAGVLVIPRGSPVLGAGGSGDILSGVVGALVAQLADSVTAAALGAFVHGLAGEIAGARGVRGVTLDEVLLAFPEAWRLEEPAFGPHLIGRLPRVADQ